jgi:hypothetical protein
MVRYHSELRPIAAAVRRDPQYAAVSDYAMQLAPFLERFGSERIMVLTHEQLIKDPHATMLSLYRWLGLDAACVDVSRFGEPENVTPDVVQMPVWNGIPRRLWQSPLVKRIQPHLPQRLQNTLREATNRSVRRQAIDVTQATDYLRSIQRRQVDALSDILGRGFPEWTTLNGRADAAHGGTIRLRPLTG